MALSRRSFLKFLAVCSGTAVGSPAKAGTAQGDQGQALSLYGCLVDLTLCEGCGKCEYECAVANDLPDKPPETCDPGGLTSDRRPGPNRFTVVNRYDLPVEGADDLLRPTFVKVQCMHCLDPACVSACIVGALTRDPETGAVVYDAGKCLGCRYCMVACPHGIPSYEYDDPLTPRVRKCVFCQERLAKGQTPACVERCPRQALTFGQRSDLLKLAWDKIRHPSSRHRSHRSYVEHVYGEHEVGGSAWLYMSSEPFEKLGFLALPDRAPPRLTETIQHGIFKHFLPPAMLFGFLGLAMHLFKKKEGDDE